MPTISYAPRSVDSGNHEELYSIIMYGDSAVVGLQVFIHLLLQIRAIIHSSYWIVVE